MSLAKLELRPSGMDQLANNNDIQEFSRCLDLVVIENITNRLIKSLFPQQRGAFPESIVQQHLSFNHLMSNVS